MTTPYVSESELRRAIATFLEQELKKPKKDQQSAQRLASQIVQDCSDYYVDKVKANLVRLFIEGDFAEKSHSHFIE